MEVGNYLLFLWNNMLELIRKTQIKNKKWYGLYKCICGVEKEFCEFHKSIRSNDGYRERCKECRKVDTTLYYQKNVDKIKENVTKYRINNPEKIKEGLDALKRAEIYTQRIDWLVSGDDGPETFLERLKEDLS
jgi:hypothetical protein